MHHRRRLQIVQQGCPEATRWTRFPSHPCGHKRNSSGDRDTRWHCEQIHSIVCWGYNASNVLNKRLIGTLAWCEKYCEWKEVSQMEDLTYISWWLGVFSVSSVSASGRRWSWARDLTLIRRKRTVSLNLSWLLISCTTPNLSILFPSLKEIYISIHPSSVCIHLPMMQLLAVHCDAVLTELRVLINGSAVSQNLVIGDWLSRPFPFFPPPCCFPLTERWLKYEHSSERSSAMSSELVSNLELTAARNNILDTFFSRSESHNAQGEYINRGWESLFVFICALGWHSILGHILSRDWWFNQPWPQLQT